MKQLFKFYFILYFSVIFSYVLLSLLFPVFISSSIVYSLGFYQINITEKYFWQWNLIKKVYIYSCFISFFIIVRAIFNLFSISFSSLFMNHFKQHKKTKNKSSSTAIVLGKTSNNSIVTIPLLGLYQNILVTGSIGSGKTSSLLYPLTEQLLSFSFNSIYKSAFLILDVKGNYHKFVKNLCVENFKTNDLYLISLNSNITYNPLDKPVLKPHVLANRLKTILLLFSPEQSEAFWLDTAEKVLTESIRLCRLYNNNYVTFTELHKLIMSKSYCQSKLTELQNKFLNNELSSSIIAELSICTSYFTEEFFLLDDRTQSIL